MSDFEVWKSYIDALDILTNQYSEPFDIKVLETRMIRLLFVDILILIEG